MPSLTEKVNGPTYQQFMRVLDRASVTLEDFATAASDTSDLLNTYAPEVGLILANARLASDQLKLTTVEVRQAPWRLLYTPGTKELENELLYDSVRTYASAVSDLRATSAILRQMKEKGVEFDEQEGQTVEGVIQRLQNAFQRYEDAEQQFLDQWIGSE